MNISVVLLGSSSRFKTAFGLAQNKQTTDYKNNNYNATNKEKQQQDDVDVNTSAAADIVDDDDDYDEEYDETSQTASKLTKVYMSVLKSNQMSVYLLLNSWAEQDAMMGNYLREVCYCGELFGIMKCCKFGLLTTLVVL